MHSVNLEGNPVQPSKIICIGRNYVAHAEELGNAVPYEMVVFLKPNSALGDTLQSQFNGEALHYETEICLLAENGQFAAVGVGLDLTRRETQSALKAKGLPWERCKAFDGAALLSDFVRFDGDVHSLHLTLHIDGVLVQRGGVEQMLFPPEVIQKDLAEFISLNDGDVVMTGTPKGVGPVPAGAVFHAEVWANETLLISAEWTAQ